MAAAGHVGRDIHDAGPRKGALYVVHGRFQSKGGLL
jgi:hypothetical protein